MFDRPGQDDIAVLFVSLIVWFVICLSLLGIGYYGTDSNHDTPQVEAGSK